MSVVRIIALALLTLCYGCQSHQTWTGGVPPDGTALSNDARMEQYARFAP